MSCGCCCLPCAAPNLCKPSSSTGFSPPTDTIRVVGVTRSGKEVPGANALSIRTPKAGAPTIAAANPTGPTTATVRLNSPAKSQAASLYMVAACLAQAPTACARKNSTSLQFSLTGLTPAGKYLVTATALVGGKVVPASNSLPLTMPAQGSPALLTAVATSALTGAATAVAPSGTTFSQVGWGRHGA